MNTPIVANILGTLGAVCWSVQLIPQIVINYRRHNTIGLQPSMMMMWAWAGVSLGVYTVTEKFNIALRIQPQILTILSLITWIQCYYYERRWSILHCAAVIVPIVLLMGGLQVALVFALRIAESEHLMWPSSLMAILSAALLAAGVLRHYWDIYIHRTVRGISFIFVGIDAAGDLFSLASVFFQPMFDILGVVVYGTELALWLGVFIAGGYFNFAPWVRRKTILLKSHRAANLDIAQNWSQEHDEGDVSTPAIALHNLPSSTSVFRTPSEIGGARSRTGVPRSIYSLGDDDHSAST
ncbi:PQ loop repeat-domain-containing protein [Lipomyces chichibuensis]|uniref:PQ loop repeat-domain-containing protein n=1 Tax=Lipomyces chichibuensis TaxID=1546026 RepID=UPI0033433DD3